MSKLLISVRITENFFTSEEIEYLNKILPNYKNKSDFLRKIIKKYLREQQLDQKNVPDLNYKKELEELKQLIKDNNYLLKNINAPKLIEPSEIYQGEEQEIKTSQILNLLDQF